MRTDGLKNLAEFIFYSISGGGQLPWLMLGYVCPSLCITDMFLLENPFSNSQDALSTRVLEQQNIFNGVYLGKAAS